MDLICTCCGEPWDIYHVLHEEPEGFDRQGGRIQLARVVTVSAGGDAGEDTRGVWSRRPTSLSFAVMMSTAPPPCRMTSRLSGLSA